MSTTPSTPSPLSADALADLASPLIQRQAADSVQDAFTRLLQHSSADAEARESGASELLHTMAGHARHWVHSASEAPAQGLRWAMLIMGLDQWGLAYTQVFDLPNMPALSALLGLLRSRMTPQEEAHFQQQYDAINEHEMNAVDFKITLRRQLHLALWAAMLSADGETQAQHLAEQLARQMLALHQALPELGWRLLADSYAHMQIHWLQHASHASNHAAQANQHLFSTLFQRLPKAQSDAIQAYAWQTVLAWREAQRQNNKNS